MAYLDLDAEMRRLDQLAEDAHAAWRSADILRDDAGGRLTLRRTGGYVEITTPAEGVCFGPASLRTIARVLIQAAHEIDRTE